MVNQKNFNKIGLDYAIKIGKLEGFIASNSKVIQKMKKENLKHHLDKKQVIKDLKDMFLDNSEDLRT